MAGEPTKGTREMQETHRARIQTSKLISRLQDTANGSLIDYKTKNPVEMTQGQIKSAEILLKKTLPDLKAIELSCSLFLEAKGIYLDQVDKDL